MVCSGLSVVFEGSREDHFSALMAWAQENGASCDGFCVSDFGSEGFGLKANRDIKVRTHLCHCDSKLRIIKIFLLDY